MAKDTKNKLLEAALEMFSQNGYAGTNIRELSASLGLGKSTLYRHFESKEEIWNAMIDEMERYYEERFGSAQKLPAVPASTEELMRLTMQMLDFTIHDKKVIMMRKILLIEQFRDERVRRIATRHFHEGLKEMFTKLFAGMMENGALRRDDPAMLAFAYTAPISALVQLCDREPENEPEIMRQIEAYAAHFIETYGNKQRKQTRGMNMKKDKWWGYRFPWPTAASKR